MSDEDRRRWDDRHAAAGPTEPAPPEAFGGDVTLLDELAGGERRALDLACGTGAQVLWAASRGWRVDALDVSPVAIERLRAAAEQAGCDDRVHGRVVDLDAGLPADIAGPYDLVVCQRFRAPHLVAELPPLLSPGGVAALSWRSVVGRDGEPGRFHAQHGELSALARAAGLEVVRESEGDGLATVVVRRAPAAMDDDAEPTLLHPAVATDVARLGVVGDVVPCDPALADTADFCAAYGYEMADSANTIVVIGKAAEPVYAACVVLATTKLAVNSVVRRRLGTRKASFAPTDATLELTDMEIGGVTAFGLPDGVPLWVDAAVMTRDRIVLGGGNRSCKLVVAPDELRKVPGVEVVDGLAAPAS